MKNIILTVNPRKKMENPAGNKMNLLVQEKDYQAISDRLCTMQPEQAAKWLSNQDEHLRFMVACKMQPEQAEKICSCAEQAEEKGYLSTPVLKLAKSRVFWLMALMISGMVTGSILARYESAFAAMPMLVTFIPMLTDTGGNAGSQSSTLVIRAMAMNEINIRNIVPVLWKEIRVGALVGAGLSIVNFFRLLFTTSTSAEIALVISLAMFLTVMMAKTVGAILPLVAGTLNCDPAIMAAPLITTVVDAFALIMYFKIAQLILGIG